MSLKMVFVMPFLSYQTYRQNQEILYLVLIPLPTWLSYKPPNLTEDLPKRCIVRYLFFMQWQEEGIVIGQKSVGEQGVLLSVFAPSHGLYKGFLKKSSLKKSPLLQAGSTGLFTWKARLHDHLGLWTQLEPKGSSLLNHFFGTKEKLFALSSILSLLETFLPERDPHPLLYKTVSSLIETIALSVEKDWIVSYLYFEISLLKEIGYGLDLDQCAVTGKKEGLCYVSPKTGCAVTKEGAGPYKDKLLPLPLFFLQSNSEKSLKNLMPLLSCDLLQGFQLTQHFLCRALEHTHSTYKPSSLPEARALLQKWGETCLG